MSGALKRTLLALAAALALHAPTRSENFPMPTVPEWPPFGEALGTPDFEAASWHVLLAVQLVDHVLRRADRPG